MTKSDSAAVVETEIERMGQSGDGVGRLADGRLLFVPGMLPGETGRVQVTEQHRSYARGELVLLHRQSPDRVAPPCPIYGQCGGCTFQHWTYEAETQYKADRVREALKRQGLSDEVVEPMRVSPAAYAYRNKGQFPFGGTAGAVTLGLYQRKSHQVVPADHCDIQDAFINEVLAQASGIAAESGIEPYVEHNRTGVLRHLLVRSSRKQQKLLLLIVAARNDPRLKRLAHRLRRDIPNVAGVGLNLNPKVGNRVLGAETRLLVGEPYLYEEVAGLTFRLSLTSFFQVNPQQAGLLYETAIGFLPDGLADVWDLYSGVGTLAALAGRRARRVRAIEVNRDAVQDAVVNFALNDLDNITMETGSVEAVIEQWQGPVPDAVIVDPPRAGLEESVIGVLERFAPRQVVYISCNPETWARDVKRFSQYELVRAVPVDMFPRTDHVEVASSLLSRHALS